MSKKNKGWIWGAAIGAVVGSVTALLLAPKSGKELRKDIADGARQVGEKTSELAEKVSDQSSQIAQKVKDVTEHLISDIQAWRECKQEETADQEMQISATTSAVAFEPTSEAEQVGIARSEATEVSEAVAATEEIDTIEVTDVTNVTDVTEVTERTDAANVTEATNQVDPVIADTEVKKNE